MSAIRPLVITSGRHPFEVAVFVAALACGIALLTSGHRPGSVTSAMPELVQALWLGGLVVSGTIGLVGVFWRGQLEDSLTIEFVGVSVLCSTTMMYAIALFAVSGTAAIGAGTFVVAVSAASLWRAVQIPLDRHRISRALDESRTADVTVLIERPDP